VLCAVLRAQNKAPLVSSGKTQEIAEHVYVIPDQRMNVVPNIGIIVGREGVLVVDTGMGPRNAETVLNEVKKITSKPVAYLTITHFHPEHGMGAQAFPAGTIVIYPTAQKAELLEKGPGMMKEFSGVSTEIADLLRPVRFRMPNITFSEEAEIDLGDFPVRLLHWESGHTLGDNFVFLAQTEHSVWRGCGDKPILPHNGRLRLERHEVDPDARTVGEAEPRHRGAGSRRSW